MLQPATTTPPVSGPDHADMVWAPAGEFLMGSNDHYPEEAPAHRVRVDGFWIDRYTVTNDQFAAFVAATGHVTVAERPPDPMLYPDADPALMVPASVVFTPTSRPVSRSDHLAWWSLVPGAQWRHPRGPGSDLAGLGEHPVVHVAWADAVAYATWVGKSLPTESEWEYAARGGRRGTEYAWGDELTPDGVHMANVWQGEFPVRNLVADGYEWTAPVGSFPANGYGAFDMIGNVWEWTSDWYASYANTLSACCGPARASEAASASPGSRVPRRVTKGGSYLCAPNYCRRYRPAARMPQELDTATCHLGFRCVVRAGGA
jgi:formylglycine-generating enzyme required for sulfatase activity